MGEGWRRARPAGENVKTTIPGRGGGGMAWFRFICALGGTSGSNMGRGTDVRPRARAARSFHCKKPKRVLASNYS